LQGAFGDAQQSRKACFGQPCGQPCPGDRGLDDLTAADDGHAAESTRLDDVDRVQQLRIQVALGITLKQRFVSQSRHDRIGRRVNIGWPVASPWTSMHYRIHGLGDEDAVEPLQQRVAVGSQHALADGLARRAEFALDLAQ
jgi:hypothetical protein